MEAFTEACAPLYEGCKTSQLSFVLTFLNTVHNHGVSNSAVDELLSLMTSQLMPTQHCLPKNLYACKKLINHLGLDYVKIDACEDGCILFRNEYAHLDQCPVCQKQRFKLVGKSRQAVKVLRHFPLIPRLKRMYRCKAISELMTWHAENKSRDGKVRHVADCRAWAEIASNIDSTFEEEPRNVHLALALDGVNPFGDKNLKHSTWPVLLLNYNLPPWLSTKKFFIMLSLLIPGPESTTDRNIDVYLMPLMEELLELWRGVKCFDALDRPGRQKWFMLRAILLWTINDYPALGLISGQVTKGYHGCVVCGPNVTCRRSSALSKNVFLGSRRWLEANHKYRMRSYASKFDGKCESRGPAPRMTCEQKLAYAAEVDEYLKTDGAKQGSKTCPSKRHGVKRTQVLAKLPYWTVTLIEAIFVHFFEAIHICRNWAIENFCSIVVTSHNL